MESVDIFLNVTTFGFWGSPKWKKNRENGRSCVVHSSVVQYKLPQGYFVRELELFLTYVLDEVAFWEDFLFLTFNILLS